jgi:hypothetical protein
LRLSAAHTGTVRVLVELLTCSLRVFPRTTPRRMGGGLSVGKIIGRGATGIVREATLDGKPVVAKVRQSGTAFVFVPDVAV